MSLVAGVDEAGRGPLAGPVVVAAVILAPARHIEGLADSKILCEQRREQLDAQIRANARCYSVVFIGVLEIERRNILQATLLGMRRALAALAEVPELALIDGNQLPKRLSRATIYHHPAGANLIEHHLSFRRHGQHFQRWRWKLYDRFDVYAPGAGRRLYTTYAFHRF